jgi:hypothetical protein
VCVCVCVCVVSCLQCIASMRESGDSTDLLALNDTDVDGDPAAWRCYSASSTTPGPCAAHALAHCSMVMLPALCPPAGIDHTHYSHGTAYCTRYMHPDFGQTTKQTSPHSRTRMHAHHTRAGGRESELLELLLECTSNSSTTFVDVFTPGELGYPCIRIPSILLAGDNRTLLPLPRCLQHQHPATSLFPLPFV